MRDSARRIFEELLIRSFTLDRDDEPCIQADGMTIPFDSERGVKIRASMREYAEAVGLGSERSDRNEGRRE